MSVILEYVRLVEYMQANLIIHVKLKKKTLTF
jgi:hypothetical protein